MICYLSHKSIDKSKWDECIGNSPQGLVYALSWYLDIVHPGWEALVKDDYTAVMPLTGGCRFGVHYLFQPFFAQQLGVFSKDIINSELLRGFFNSIPDKYRFVEIRLNSSNTLDYSIKKIEYHHDIILDLSRDYPTVQDGYHTNTKRNLSKASSHNLRLEKEVSIDRIIALFRANRGASVSVWRNHEYDVLRHLCAEAISRGFAFLNGVADAESGEICCGALFLRWGGRIIFLFSGNNETGKESQAMTFLIDSVIQDNCNSPVVFDFEGSDDDNLARFYRGFGGSDVTYPSYYCNKLSAFGKFLLKYWKKL